VVNNYYKVTVIGPQPIRIQGFIEIAPREHSNGHRRGEVTTNWLFPFLQGSKASEGEAVVKVRNLLAALKAEPASKFKLDETRNKVVNLIGWLPVTGWPAVGET
jgi:hypothetical protein